MSILIDDKTEVLIQGITGRHAQLMVKYMREYGTRVMAGVTPGKGGTSVDGIPVYNSVKEAKENHPGIVASAIYVPPRSAKAAAFDAIEAGVKLVAFITERVPQHDMLEVIQLARDYECLIIGPNTIGIISPGKAILGNIGAKASLAHELFMPGPAGVLSRSGGQTTTTCYYLTREGIGQSTAIGVGGDAFVGASWAELLPLFEKDPDTKMVVGFGEIGTTVEEEAADLIKAGGFTKPLVAYISGKNAVEGVRFGHAGAMIARGKGTAQSKIKALKESGAIAVEHYSDIGKVAKQILQKGK